MVKPVPPSPSDPAISCPKCHIVMVRLDADGVAIDRCDKCGGVWLDAGELTMLLKFSGDKKQLIEQIDIGAATEEVQRHSVGIMLCPRDKSAMNTVADRKQQHIEFEVCMVCCGVFFDAGELADLSEFTLRERLAAFFGSRGR
ncbi:MAG: zf-TFIIB domain-containing protein [Phycisphaeraceae bacterium]|nr:zf-TFIIB domain-containing protein [Phycisphaeraceae bacterium]MCW5754233.1 zf-TFIIB domain-containing protein [Phycisphaeraceae bacterium]